MKTFGLTFSLLVASIAGLAPASASAAVVVNSPFGSEAEVSVYIGSDINNRPMACYDNDNGSDPIKAYFFTNIEQTALSTNVEVHGGLNADTLVVVEAPRLTPCGLMRTLNQNGFKLSALGGAGNDRLRGGVASNTLLCGQDGNDVIDLTADFGIASGGNGDDVVRSTSLLSTHESLYGEAGLDCLYDLNILAGVLSGGADHDVSPNYSPWFGMLPSLGCDVNGTCDVEAFGVCAL